jgi:hypothetical protein
MRSSQQLSLLVVLAVVAASTAQMSVAQDPKPSSAATVAEARKVLDLSTFPLLPDAKASGARRLAELNYSAKCDPKSAFEFQKKTLESMGFQELPGTYLSDMSCSGAFGKDHFTVAVSVSPGYDANSAGKVQVQLNNLGNVELNKLPVPPDAKPLYAFPASVAYVTEKSVKETSETLRSMLLAEGWEPYGDAGESLYFKKNAVKISAWPSVAPAQGNKTVIQYGSTLMSVDLPAPSKALRVAYADTTKAISIDVDMKAQELFDFYRESLGKSGWKATTKAPFKDGFQEMALFRNDAKDIITMTMHNVSGKLRANVDHQTEAEFNERIKRAEAADAKRKADSTERRKMIAKKEAAKKEIVSITVPSQATDLKSTKDRLEFKLPSGTAKAAVEALRDELVQSGWKANASALQAVAGSVLLTKKPSGTVSLTYVDTGVSDAEVTISTFSGIIEQRPAK